MLIENPEYESSGPTRIFSVQCDYCGVLFQRTKRSIQNGRKHIVKDACCSCTHLKRADVCMHLYGVSNGGATQSSLDKSRISWANYEGGHPSRDPKVVEKSKKTCMEKYDCETYLGSKKNRERLCEYFSKEENVKKSQSKSDETNLERYGAKRFTATKEGKIKIRDTLLERYGVSNVAKIPGVMEKIKKTMLELYGEDSPLKVEKFQKKKILTNMLRYGVEHYLQCEDGKNRVRKTSQEKYGVDWPSKHSEVAIKRAKTNIEKYGSPFPHHHGKTENDIKLFIEQHGNVFNSDCEILSGKEIDLYNKDLKLGIEYCGLYWHCEDSPEPRTRRYHYEKYNECKKNGIRLITIFEDEWNERQDQVKSYLEGVVGNCSEILDARKCELVDGNDLVELCKDWHIQGAPFSYSKCFGLSSSGKIVGVVVGGMHHRGNNRFVLSRLCFQPGTRVRGGAGKLTKYLLNFAKENGFSEMFTWSDNRWSSGNVYQSIGFSKDAELPPDYSWVDMKKGIRYSKQSMRKKDSLTEKDYWKNKGYSRIWDCGKIRWKIN